MVDWLIKLGKAGIETLLGEAIARVVDPIVARSNKAGQLALPELPSIFEIQAAVLR
jgi:hypothetical protein